MATLGLSCGKQTLGWGIWDLVSLGPQHWEHRVLAVGPAGKPLDILLKQVKEWVISVSEIRFILTERTARPRDTWLLGVFSKTSKEAGVTECCVQRNTRRQARRDKSGVSDRALRLKEGRNTPWRGMLLPDVEIILLLPSHSNRLITGKLITLGVSA